MNNESIGPEEYTFEHPAADMPANELAVYASASLEQQQAIDLIREGVQEDNSSQE